MAAHRFARLSADDFGRLVYRLVKRCGDFGAVQWYSDIRGQGGVTKRGIVARKPTGARYERWYIQCQHHARINYATLRHELDALAQHTAESPGFTPNAVVFAIACNTSSRVKDKATAYARTLGLPAPLYWDWRELDKMLAPQPETREEFFGKRGRLFNLGARFASFGNWGVAVILGAALLLAIRVLFSLPSPPREATPASVLMPTREPTPIPVAAITSTPTNTPTPTSTPTPSPTNTPTPTPKNTPIPIPTDTPTPTPTPLTTSPILLHPMAGVRTRAAVLRWTGELRPGQSFLVRLQHLGSNQIWTSGALTTSCWDATLPVEWYGGWRWQVQIVQGDTVVAQSDEQDFWFDPFPSDKLAYPLACGE